MAEKLIELNSVETALEIFGSRDENIRLLENEFSITAVCRGSQIKFTGEPEQVAAAARAVDAMLTLLEKSRRCATASVWPAQGKSAACGNSPRTLWP